MLEAKSISEKVNEKFLKKGFILTKDALELLITQSGYDRFINHLKDRKMVFVSREIVEDFYFPRIEEKRKFEFKAEKLPLDKFLKRKRPKPRRIEAEIEIVRNVSDQYSEGKFQDFLELFQDRFERLSRIFRMKPSMRDFSTIPTVLKRRKREKVKAVGIVTEKRVTSNNNVILTIEDRGEFIKVLVHNRWKKLFELARYIVEDEVIGVEGVMGESIIFANAVEFPDIPIGRSLNKSRKNLSVALISDLHVGSKMFLEKAFLRFVRWLNLKYEKQMELASTVKYLIIAGDLVDGIGIYPNQREELEIDDLLEQYEKTAELLSLVPERIKILIVPGNHDAVRTAEPQLPISELYAKPLYELENVMMLGNPCVVDLHSVRILIYHGASLIETSSKFGLSFERAPKIMELLLRKRHLSPIYGTNPIVPLSKDQLLIEDVPDLFVTGHIHVTGHSNYRGTTLINAGCWMKQSQYQKMRNINPTPAKIPIFNLKNHNTTIMNFGG